VLTKPTEPQVLKAGGHSPQQKGHIKSTAGAFKKKADNYYLFLRYKKLDGWGNLAKINRADNKLKFVLSYK
jgi:hypothetical protein